MTNIVRKNPVMPPSMTRPSQPASVSSPNTTAVFYTPPAPPYTAEPEPPQYINEVWKDGGISGPDAIPLVYGERIVEGRVIAQWQQGDTKVGIIGLCGGPIDSIVSVWFDDWFDQPETIIPYDAGYSSATGKDGWTYQLGSLSQAAIGTTLAGYYGANQSFPTLAYIIVYIPQFVVQGSLVIPTDRPWPGGFRARVKGRTITDTRTSSTVWSANPAQCLQHFLASENYGGNVGGANLDTASFNAASDACDAASLTLNIVIDGNSGAKQWADTIAACFGARLYVKDGKYALWMEGVTSDSGILFDTSNSRDWTLSETPTTDRPTRVVVEYSRASNNWAPDQAISEVSGSVAVRETSYKLDGVTNATQAKWLADLYLWTQQTAPWRVAFTASALAARLSLGTRFKLTFPNGCTAQDFLATEIEPLENGEFRIAARQYLAGVYTPGSVPTPPPAPSPGTLPSDAPPDVTITGYDDYWVLRSSSTPDQMVEDLYLVLEYTLPTYVFAKDLVVRGITSISTIGSDQAWSALGDETVIPLAGNLLPGSTFRLYWPVIVGDRARAYYPSLAAGASLLSRLACQVTVRLRNTIGLMSAGAIKRLSTPVDSTSGGGADPGSVLQTTRELRLVEAPANGTNYWKIKTAASLSVDRNLTLPDVSPDVGPVTIDTGGNIAFRKDFCFHATKGGTSQTGITTATATKVTFTTEDFDDGAGYDASNSKFLPGVAGKYQINAAVTVVPDATATMVKVSLYKTGSEVKAAALQGSDSGHGLTAAISCVLDLGASDYLEVYVYHTKSGNGAVEGAATVSHFSGVRVG